MMKLVQKLLENIKNISGEIRQRQSSNGRDWIIGEKNIKNYLKIEEFLKDEYVCRDIFLYDGYNIGYACPKCGGRPNLEDDDKQRCFCYDEALKIWKDKIKKGEI